MARANRAETSSCVSRRSAYGLSKRSAQRWAPLSASMSWALIRTRLPSLWTLPSTGQSGKILYDSWLRLLALEFLTMVWRRALGDEAPRILEPTTERLSGNFARGCVVSLLHSGVL